MNGVCMVSWPALVRSRDLVTQEHTETTAEMTANRVLRSAASLVFLMIASACTDRAALTEPEPEPPELPEPLQADVVRERGFEAWRKYFMAHTYYELTLPMSVTADVLTGNCCWVRFENLEPRQPYDNHVLSTTKGVAESPWHAL